MSARATASSGHGAAELPTERFRRGLLVQLAGLGDLVMALPAIDALLARFPDTEWTLLTRPAQAPLLEGRGIRVLSMPWPPSIRSLCQQMATVRRLRRRRFDVAVHLYALGSRKGVWGMRALFAAIHAGISIGRVHGGQRPFDVNWDEAQMASRHEVDLNLGMLSVLGISASAALPIVHVPDELSARISKRLRELFPGDPALAIVFPGGARPTRHWPIENYVELVRYLRGRGMAVCIVGGHAEAGDAARLAEGDAMVANLAGSLTLLELSALMKAAKLYVGNDSGPTHLAAAVGLATVVIVGPGDMERYAPRGTGAIRIARFEVDCSPCYRQTCAHHTCLRSLTVGMVKQQVEAVLGEGTA